MKRSMTWLVYCTLILAIAGILFGIKVLISPLGNYQAQQQGLEGLFGTVDQKAKLSLHATLPDLRIRHVFMYDNKTTMVEFEALEHRGSRIWWAAFDPSYSVKYLFPEPSLFQSSLFLELGQLDHTGPGAFTLDELDAITGATIDRDLLYKRLKELPEIIVKLVEGKDQ